MTRETHTASTTDARKRQAEAATNPAPGLQVGDDAATRDTGVELRMNTARLVAALQLVADDVRAGHGDDLAEYVAASIREHFEMPLRMLADHDARVRHETVMSAAVLVALYDTGAEAAEVLRAAAWVFGEQTEAGQ